MVSYIISQFPTTTPAQKEAKQAYLDAPNEYGNTGMHWAALGGHLPIVKLLMDHGASPALANDKNYVPLDLASFGEKNDVVDFFLAQAGGLESENVTEGLSAAAAAGIKITESADGDVKMSIGDVENGKAEEASK